MNVPLRLVRRAALNLALAAAFLPAGLAGQDNPPPPPPDTTEAELVFEREVYAYPTFDRRDPFSPLISGAVGEPRFEDLRLLGIIYSTDPAQSVALLGIDLGGAAARAGDSYRVRRGDRVGNTRILAIQRDRILVEVEEFGLTEQRSLIVQRPTEGGSR